MPLSDEYPVLLGPVRVETRFTETELLVRIFPDEWSIDKFEPLPSQAEFDALRAYWAGLWRAGGRAVAEQAAWQEFTARVPAGRAVWLADQHRPANQADRPTGVPDTTTVLIVVTPTALPPADVQPTVVHWSAVWRAHGDPAKLRAAEAALLAAVGAARARAIRARTPVGVENAADSESDAVLVAVLVLPAPARTTPDSWTTPAVAHLLPDRFTVVGYHGSEQVLTVTGEPVPERLAVSPDPSSNDRLRLDEDTGELTVPADLKWLTEFGEAVRIGMGLRIPRTGPAHDGFDRLVVIGLRERTPQATDTARELGKLITRQLHSPSGYALLPQGTPTNNTAQAPAGTAPREEAAAALRARSAARSLAAAGDWTAKSDGQWFAELLGLDPGVLTGMPHADGTDQSDARAADTALWPATWGSYLATTLHPVLTPQAVEQIREFFLRHVSGRGPVPAVRIGRQPYGVLPTTAFSRLTWPENATHRRALAKVLDAVQEDWREAAAKVAHVLPPAEAPPGHDPHQRLLDILALHPTSAEYHQRYARSVPDIYNRENLGATGPAVLAALEEQLRMPQPIRALLARLGYPAAPPAVPDPDLVRRLFTGAQHPLLGPLVDDRPLSETEPVRAYTAAPESWNYLRWLERHGRRNLDTVRLENGFDGGRAPAALLYLLLRHAVLLNWEEAGHRLAAAAGRPVPSPADPLFIHVRTQRAGEPHPPPSESRYRQLYAPDPELTHNPDPSFLLHQHIPAVLDSSPATARLKEQLDAVAHLAELPTARLERLVAEHLDCATYRLDAWRLGLANERLSQLRYGADGTAPPKQGVHIGAYGWLEQVRPRRRPATEVRLGAELTKVLDTPTVPHETSNGGYIHTPSPAHARTAAVLRAGYLANGSRRDPDAFAVNLSSERVRAALSLLDGLRQGQSLGALLGYRFERGLHEGHPRYPDVELDKFLPALRAAFPLRARKLSHVLEEPDGTEDVVEARNVVDGLALVRRATRPPMAATWPFGARNMPAATVDEANAMNEELRKLLALHDALGDLAVAEGTHQALLGNPERASATLDAYAKEGFPPDPAVVQTPRGGTTLTHRFALSLSPGLNPGLTDSPRARAEPAVEDWLPALLPAAQDVVALVTWTDPVSKRPRERVVSQRDADLSSIDLLWALRPAGEAAMSDLDDRIVGVVVDRDQPRPDAELTIRYTVRVDDKVTFFELSPLVDALRTLLTTSRPLRPTDLVPAAGGTAVDRRADEAVTIAKDRPLAVRDTLSELGEDVAAFLEDLAPLYPPEPAPPRRADVLDRIDAFLTAYAGLVTRAGAFGMLRSGWGELTQWRRAVFTDVLAAVAETAARMRRALVEAEGFIGRHDALPHSAPDEERFTLLEQAERLLTTAPTSPRPQHPALLRATVGQRHSSFDSRLRSLEGVADTGRATLSGLLAQVRALLPLSAFDALGLDPAPFEDRVVVQGRELLTRATSLDTDIACRVQHADAALTSYDSAVTGPDRVQCARDALTAMLGDDVLVVPEFTASTALAAEWKKARDDSARLVRHLTADFDRDFPVDDWVHGVARVRDKPRLWEKAIHLGDALQSSGSPFGVLTDWEEPQLTPVQFPYRRDDAWLAMEFRRGTEIDEDKLLFTAHYADGPLPLSAQRCGLLLDEWTEVIPAERETTGIAVHYDGPDAEAPQALLLVVPPVKRPGGWDTGDLLAAVNETYDLARLRAVEPGHLDDTAYAHLLPATVLSATRQPITLSTDLAVSNLRWKAEAHD
ncbi:hypothetical protein [Streptomyces aureocirculatus]|uniref:hypothetical protein n=1 Tax=Streptomyces aureocirculatus TaxID=67275 RepID=UPI0004C7D7F6|nr:hypothetical protein [Streptomyces aureocirculatus]